MCAADRDGDGDVWNLTRPWAWRPDVHEVFAAARAALGPGTTLTAREQAVLVTATARALGDSCCDLAWGARLASQVGGEAAAAVIRGEPAGALSPRERALAEWAERVTRAPGETTPEDVARLREAGLDDREVFEATVVVAFPDRLRHGRRRARRPARRRPGRGGAGAGARGDPLRAPLLEVSGGRPDGVGCAGPAGARGGAP